MVTAVTGGIAEGKSTVLAYLAELGFSTLSADAVAAGIFQDPEVNKMLAAAASEPWPISAQTLRGALTSRPEVRRATNRIMHPRIEEQIRQSGADFIEVPLLVETCVQGHFDQVWVVTCGPAEQRRRLSERYGPSLNAFDLLATQLPTSVKIPFADEVFRTNRTFTTVRRDVKKALTRRLNLGGLQRL